MARAGPLPIWAAHRLRLRRRARRWVANILAGTSSLIWRGRRSHLVALMYHRVLPRSDSRYWLEEPGMIVTPETLALHVRILAQHFTIVSVSDWLEGRLDPGQGPFCALTFDDGWHDNYEFAWPILRAEGIPATIFLVSDMVGTHTQFWPARLLRIVQILREGNAAHDSALEWARSLCGPGVEVSTGAGRADIVDAAKRFPDSEILRKLERCEMQLGIGPEDPGQRTVMNWDEARELADSELIEFGSHTRHHARLVDNLDPETMIDEIMRSADIMEHRLGRRPALFSYPNGDTCPAAEAMVGETYKGALTTRPGWNGPRSDPYHISRIGMHEDISATSNEFIARLTGWL